MFCTNCGAQNVDNAKFCVQCGNPIQILPKSQEKNKVFIPNQMPIDSNSNYAYQTSHMDVDIYSDIRIESEIEYLRRYNKEVLNCIILGLVFALFWVGIWYLYINNIDTSNYDRTGLIISCVLGCICYFNLPFGWHSLNAIKKDGVSIWIVSIYFILIVWMIKLFIALYAGLVACPYYLIKYHKNKKKIKNLTQYTV